MPLLLSHGQSGAKKRVRAMIQTGGRKLLIDNPGRSMPKRTIFEFLEASKFIEPRLWRSTAQNIIEKTIMVRAANNFNFASFSSLNPTERI